MVSAFTPSHRGGSGVTAGLPARVHRHVAHLGAGAAGARAPPRRARADAARPRRRPAARGPVSAAVLVDAVERAMDEAGFGMAHIVGNSLGGYVALPARRARPGDVRRGIRARRRLGPGRRVVQGEPWTTSRRCGSSCAAAAPHAEAIVATPRGSAPRDAAHRDELRAHPARAARPPDARRGSVPGGRAAGRVRAARRLAARGRAITCPVRVVWGTDDRLLPWPGSAARFRDDWLAACRLGRARRRRPLPPARRPARDGAADRRLHDALTLPEPGEPFARVRAVAGARPLHIERG